MDTTKDTKPRWFTPQEVADYFGVTRDAVLRWIRSGRIRPDEYVRPGGKLIKIFPQTLERLATPTSPPPPPAKERPRRTPEDFKEQARRERESLARRFESLLAEKKRKKHERH